jgi:hypothetical protein
LETTYFIIILAQDKYFFKNILYPLSNTRPRYQEILWSRDLLFIFARSHMILLEIIRDLISSCELTEDLCLKISHEILAEILTRVCIDLGVCPTKYFFFAQPFAQMRKNKDPFLAIYFFAPPKIWLLLRPWLTTCLHPNLLSKINIMYFIRQF